jgi:hypothetical protein
MKLLWLETEIPFLKEMESLDNMINEHKKLTP